MRYIFFGDENFHDDIAVRLANAGFERCADIEEASAIITFCTSQSALEDAYFDEGGFVQSAHPGAVLIDFSASTPGFARELGAVATVSDLGFVEAPIALEDMLDPRLCRRRLPSSPQSRRTRWFAPRTVPLWATASPTWRSPDSPSLRSACSRRFAISASRARSRRRCSSQSCRQRLRVLTMPI